MLYIVTSVPDSYDKSEINEFTLTVKSATNRERKYTMYYAIVPANK